MQLFRSSCSRLLPASAILVLAFSPLFAETTITIRPHETIEIFAKTHLKNPRQWRQVLRYNRIHADQFRPGIRLAIPRTMERRGDAAVLSVQAAARFSRKLRDRWSEMHRSLKLYSGDRIKTDANGRVHLVFRNRMHVQIKSDTRVILNDHPSRTASDLFLQEGRIRSFKKTPGQVSFRVVTPAAIASVRGTDFSVEVEPGGRTRISCHEGSVAVSAQGKHVLLKASRTIVIEPGKQPGPLTTLPPPPLPR